MLYQHLENVKYANSLNLEKGIYNRLLVLLICLLWTILQLSGELLKAQQSLLDLLPNMSLMM